MIPFNNVLIVCVVPMSLLLGLPRQHCRCCQNKLLTFSLLITFPLLTTLPLVVDNTVVAIVNTVVVVVNIQGGFLTGPPLNMLIGALVLAATQLI